MVRIAVGDVMTRSPVSVPSTANLFECAKKMAQNRVNSLLIADSKKLRAILTSRDILWLITKKPTINLKTINVMDIATRKVAVIKPSADISEALAKMRSLNFRRLPVIANGLLVGVITLKDILRIDPSLYSLLGELQDIKEEERKLSSLKKDWPLEGFCENCNSFNELLNVNGRLLCTDCRAELY